MKHLTIILTSAALALSVLNACASPKDGNEFKETALSGTPVRMDIPDTPINSVLSNNGHIVTLSKIENREAGSVSSSVSVYSAKEEDIVLKGTLSLPGVTIYDKIMLFPMDTEGYICGVSVMSTNRFYGITGTVELKELEALEQKTKGHVFNYSFTAPVCLLDKARLLPEQNRRRMAPVSWSSLRQRQHDSIRIQFLQGSPVLRYRKRQGRLHILRRAGVLRRVSP